MYKEILLSFEDNIESLESFVEHVEPTLKDNISIAEMEEILAKIEVTKAIAKEVAATLENEGKPQDLIGKSITLGNGETLEIDSDNLKINVKEVLKLGMKIKKENSNYGILYKSALMSLIIYLESTISDIIKESCLEHPERLGNKTISLKEVKESGSIEEAISKIVENEIESLMFKGFSEWVKFLKEKMKVTLNCLDRYSDELTEIISRRNIMVHNRGIVNHTYLSKVPKEFKKNIKLGDVLKVDRKYIDRAMNTIEIICYLTLIEVILKEDKDKPIEIIEDLSYRKLKEEKWEVTLEMYDFLSNIRGIQESDRLLYQINCWQCYKWLGRYDEVKDLISKKDISLIPTNYKLCIHALKDEFDEFFKLLNSEYDICKDTIDLEEWPIFREIRKKEEYEKFKVIDIEPCLD